MKNADSIRAKFGANIVESMGDAPAGAGGLPTGFAAQASGQYAGTGRIRDALAIELDRIVPDPDQPRREFDEAALPFGRHVHAGGIVVDRHRVDELGTFALGGEAAERFLQRVHVHAVFVVRDADDLGLRVTQ